MRFRDSRGPCRMKTVPETAVEGHPPRRPDHRDLHGLWTGDHPRSDEVHPRAGPVDRLHRATVAPGLGPAMAGGLGRGWDHLARLDPAAAPQAVLQTGIPTVDLNDQVRDLGLPQIHSDHAAIARLAAEHLHGSRVSPLRLFRVPGFRMVGAPARRVRRVHSRPAGGQFHENECTRGPPGAISNRPGRGR